VRISGVLARVLGSTYFAEKAEFIWMLSSGVAARDLESNYFTARAKFRKLL